MFDKYRIASYILSVITFVLQIGFLFAGIFANHLFFIGMGVVWGISSVYGGWLQWIGAKYHESDSDTITAGFGMEIPLCQFLTIYFTYRFWKWNVNKDKKQERR